ncbi:glycosyltransferase [Algoriphagus sp. CAU 1675]|uniref:glycosyltransferase n=1 Tax=Algoriphagus sp. CAU 1675 TaxID=3032597 RepID=UPI0023DAE2F3|nr:glycosyltransferase [Algoriphagus sp. CAU 1675]MDF2158188.1 glycosyltransferase [Algoriphagus sp. CAU 1675]
MLKIDVLICCYNESIYNVSNIILPRQYSFINYIVSHQISNSLIKYNYSAFNFRNDLNIFPIYGNGLSINRNNALLHSKADICLLADDDVSYSLDYFINIISAFKLNDFDVIVGKINTGINNFEYKKYESEMFMLNKRSLFNVSSIEIAFKRNSIICSNIKFDSRFGLGSKFGWNFGEETIFLFDCYFNKKSIVYFPLFFVNHDFESSGKNKIYSKNYFYARSAFLTRISTLKGIVYFSLSPFFLFFKYYKHLSFFNCLYFSFLGFFKEIKTR